MTCDHAWMTVYSWRPWTGYRLRLVCLRCPEEWRLPGHWWRTSSMEAAARAWREDVHSSRLRRLEGL